MKETITGCKEALSSLDFAAESTLQLFSRLETNNSGEELTGEDAAQLFNDATELLPLILEKVNAVERLVRCRKNNNFCGSGWDRLAEGKSDRIAEMSKGDNSIL